MTNKKTDIENLLETAVLTADQRKAENIVTLKLDKLSVIADYFMICNAGSEPHVKAISSYIEKDVKEKFGKKPISIEGKAESGWVLIDYGALVIHVMTPETREHYQLDSLWSDAPKKEAIDF